MRNKKKKEKVKKKKSHKVIHQQITLLTPIFNTKSNRHLHPNILIHGNAIHGLVMYWNK